MQTANKTQAHQQSVVASTGERQSPYLDNGPLLIAAELLQLVSGGKGAPASQLAAAPVNKW